MANDSGLDLLRSSFNPRTSDWMYQRKPILPVESLLRCLQCEQHRAVLFSLLDFSARKTITNYRDGKFKKEIDI